jgi:hypothetical protein
MRRSVHERKPDFPQQQRGRADELSQGTGAKRNCGALRLVKLISLHNEKNNFSYSSAPMIHSLHSADSLYSPDPGIFFEKLSAAHASHVN